MPLKLYFHDRDGNELADHPLNGCECNGTGAALSTRGVGMDREGGEGVMWRDGSGRIARHTIYRYDFESRKSLPVTVADFPGYRHVLVKEWVPRDAGYEPRWYWLVPQDNRLNAK